MTPLRERWALPATAAGVGLLVCAVPIALVIHDSSTVHAWGDVVTVGVTDRDGPWRLMRGSLAYAAIPALFVLLAGMALTLFRSSARGAGLLLGVALAANLAIQALKHPGPVDVSALAAIDPLSGHVGVVSAITLGWLAFGPPRFRRLWAWCAVAATGGVSMGVVLAGWHTVPQVVVPLVVCTGWVLAFTPASPRPPARLGVRAVLRGPVMMTLGLLAAITGLAVADRTPVVGTTSSASVAVAVTCGVVLGLSLASTGAVWWAVDASARNGCAGDVTSCRRRRAGAPGPADPAAPKGAGANRRPISAFTPQIRAIWVRCSEVDEAPRLD